MGISCQLHALAALALGKELSVPTEQEAGQVLESGWIRWWREKFPVHAGTQPWSSSP